MEIVWEVSVKSLKHLVVILSGVVCALGIPACAQHQHPAGDPEKLGTVRFTTSCAPAVQQEFERAVAMLHSFWYEKAARAFDAVAQKEPDCAMAYWGLAMTHYHPLWEKPHPDALEQGRAAVEKGIAAGAKTARERDYVAAIEVFYRDADKLDHRARALGYEKAMEQLHQKYPDDTEAAIFYALAVRGNALDTDKTYAQQKKAGAIAEKLFAAQPEHPGLAHYIIHSYDYPSLAQRALDAARRYAKIAPSSPHALHMPSHIFTRLGYWQESIESNRASAAAARQHGDTGDELHAMDYLMYAYLQGAQDREAAKLLQALPETKKNTPTYFAGVYARASMPARFAVERRRWAEAAVLPVPPNVFPGGRQAWAEGSLHFAHGLGAARTGDLDGARIALQRLASLRDALVQAKEADRANEIEVHRRTVAAWLARAEGKNEEALRLMRSAADLEDATEKHPVTPGSIVPARELLGDLVLELKQPAEALREFEATLKSAPNRFNALAGAARAAELSADSQKAAVFYARLVELCQRSDTPRPELLQARVFLANHAKERSARQEKK